MTPARTSPGRWALAAAGAALAAAALLLLWPRGPRPAPPPPAAPAAAPAPAPATPAPAADEPLEPAPAAAEPPEEDPPPDEESVQAAIARARHAAALYAETRAYPPWSRPADGSTRHLIDWNRPFPVGQPFAADEERREIHVELSLDRMFAGPGESLRATLAVFRPEDDQRVPQRPDRLAGRVEVLEPGAGWRTVWDVAFEETGGAWSASFTPQAIADLAGAPREARFVAEVHLGEFRKLLPVGFRYATAAELVVHGVAGDRVVDGSLEVDLDVDVRRVAPTLVQAALFDGAGRRAIAVFDDYVRPARGGRQLVTLRFSGKAIADAGIDGPYRLRSLHGLVKRFGEDPEEVFWAAADDPGLVTAPHRAAAFSAAEWSGPEKDAKAAQYQDFIRELEQHRN